MVVKGGKAGGQEKSGAMGNFSNQLRPKREKRFRGHPGGYSTSIGSTASGREWVRRMTRPTTVAQESRNTRSTPACRAGSPQRTRTSPKAALVAQRAKYRRSL